MPFALWVGHSHAYNSNFCTLTCLVNFYAPLMWFVALFFFLCLTPGFPQTASPVSTMTELFDDQATVLQEELSAAHQEIDRLRETAKFKDEEIRRKNSEVYDMSNKVKVSEI